MTSFHPIYFRSCPAHLEAGLTRVVLEETRNHYHGSQDGGLNDPADSLICSETDCDNYGLSDREPIQ